MSRGSVAVWSWRGGSVVVVNGWLSDGDGRMFDGSGWRMIFPIMFMVLVALMLFGFWRSLTLRSTDEGRFSWTPPN